MFFCWSFVSFQAKSTPRRVGFQGQRENKVKIIAGLWHADLIICKGKRENKVTRSGLGIGGFWRLFTTSYKYEWGGWPKLKVKVRKRKSSSCTRKGDVLWLSKMRSRMFVAALRLVLTTPTDWTRSRKAVHGFVMILELWEVVWNRMLQVQTWIRLNSNNVRFFFQKRAKLQHCPNQP